jgi:hypothetical protein
MMNIVFALCFKEVAFVECLASVDISWAFVASYSTKLLSSAHWD